MTEELHEAVTGELKVAFPAQGWKQFLTSRGEMLAAYDSAKGKAGAHDVEVFHGNVAEAEFRKWLGRFLPKRFGVTSGYVISQGVKDSVKAPHFDVIIYDHLASPVLWIEDSPDRSEQGHSRAIPAEHVQSVLEVKAKFQSSSVESALLHLGELKALMSGMDAPNERYKLYLPSSFTCGVVFFELAAADIYNKAALDKIANEADLRGFFGGLILRAEDLKAQTGRIVLLRSDTPMEGSIGKGKESLLQAPTSDSFKSTDGSYRGAMLTWGEPFFAQFAFDLLAMLEGTFEPGRVSAFHGLGKSP